MRSAAATVAGGLLATAALVASAVPAAAGNAAPPSGTTAAPVAPLAPQPPRTLCRITDARLPELSGLAVAGDHLLAMNDGGDRVTVYVLDSGCRIVDARTAPIDPYDPEDMALAADGTIWLADIGDNLRARSTVALIALRSNGSAALYRLSYPDGAHDAESLLLAPDGTPYLVTKEVLGTSGVYRPSAPLVAGATVALAKVGAVTFTLTGNQGGPVGRAGQLMATGGAVSGDGRLLALRTYTDAYVWPLTGSDVVGALRRDPLRVALPPSRQGEAIGFAQNGHDLVVSGEQLPVDVTVIPIDLPAAAPAAAGSATGSASGSSAATSSAGPGIRRSPITSGVIAAVVAALLVWLGGKLRRRRN